MINKVDCKRLSIKSREIFERIKAHYPPDPWGKPRWIEEGIVYDNSPHDLRKSDDRVKLIDRYETTIGSVMVALFREQIVKNRKIDWSFVDFRMYEKWIELAALIHELDTQIFLESVDAN